MRTQHLIGAIGLAVTLMVVLAIVLNPTTVDAGREQTVAQLLAWLHSHGMPVTFQYDHLEFSANVIMFLPLGFFLAFLIPPRYWWVGGLALALLSVACETAQLVFLPDRFATFRDLAANSIGAFLGLALAHALIHCLVHRDSAAPQTLDV